MQGALTRHVVVVDVKAVLQQQRHNLCQLAERMRRAPRRRRARTVARDDVVQCIAILARVWIETRQVAAGSETENNTLGI